jgi:predicted acetyltransferase
MIKLYDEYASESKSNIVPNHNPHFEGYENLEKAGILSVFCAYVDNKIVGFIISATVRMLHYTDLSTTIESIFVDKNHRKGTGIGNKLIEAVQQDAKERGSVTMLISAPVGSNLDKICKRRFKHTSNFYGISI